MKKIAVIIVLIIAQTLTAQNYKLSKVSEAELLEKSHPDYPEASAAILYSKHQVRFDYQQGKGFIQNNEIHQRIKIYTKEGFDYATKTISLYENGSSHEVFTGLKAYTYTLENDKVEDQKLKNSDVFKTEISKFRNQVKFTMPNIKEGAIIEYKYTIRSPFVYNVDEYVFQEKIPVKKLKMIFESPEYYNFKINTKGYLSVIPKTSQKAETLSFTTSTRSSGLSNARHKTSFDETRRDYNVAVYNFDLNNVPALRNEPFVNNINNYRSTIKFELSYTKFPNTPIKSYSSNWDDVVKTIYKSKNFGDQLNKTSYFKSDIDQLLAATNDPLEKAGLLFNYVKKHVKWNGYYSKYVDVGVRKAYKEHVGNSAEINLMLTAMLRYAGINANPVLVSTRNNGVPLFPTREGYNYVISAIEIQNDVILLDATSMYSSPNILPFRVLNWQGRIVREAGSSVLVDLYPNSQATSTTYMNVNIEENGMVSGKIRNMKTNHNAMSFREAYINSDKDEYLEKFENNLGEVEVSNFEISNDLELSKPIVVNYDFVAEDQFETIGDKLFISPMLFFTTDENPFKLETRSYPVDFGYPSITKYNINIKVPEGFKVESVPAKAAMQLPDNLGRFKL